MESSGWSNLLSGFKADEWLGLFAFSPRHNCQHWHPFSIEPTHSTSTTLTWKHDNFQSKSSFFERHWIHWQFGQHTHTKVGGNTRRSRFPPKASTHTTHWCVVYGRRRTFGVKKKGGKNLVNWPTEFFSPNVGLHKQSFRDFIFISAAEMGSSVCVC